VVSEGGHSIATKRASVSSQTEARPIAASSPLRKTTYAQRQVHERSTFQPIVMTNEPLSLGPFTVDVHGMRIAYPSERTSQAIKRPRYRQSLVDSPEPVAQVRDPTRATAPKDPDPGDVKVAWTNQSQGGAVHAATFVKGVSGSPPQKASADRRRGFPHERDRRWGLMNVKPILLIKHLGRYHDDDSSATGRCKGRREAGQA
jgi:hypothetical protein